MAKFDAVDRLMQQAMEKPGGTKQTTSPTEAADRAPLPTAAAAPSQTGGQHLVGVLQSLGPVFGTVLRRVNHPAAKAAAELLPLAGTVGARLLETGRAAAAAKAPAPSAAEPQLRAALDTQQTAFRKEMEALRERVEAQDEQIRRMRESLERTVAEQGTIALKLNRSADRSRLLSAGVVILLLLSITQAVLLAIVLRR